LQIIILVLVIKFDHPPISLKIFCVAQSGSASLSPLQHFFVLCILVT
jgi:hypothetical protein